MSAVSRLLAAAMSIACLPAAAEAQEAVAGEKLFKRCVACHSTVAGENKVGPTLFGIVDRPLAAIEGFKYSDGMKAKGGTWTAEALDAYLTNPRQVVPGTFMSFMGLKKPEERAALIDYLRTLK